MPHLKKLLFVVYLVAVVLAGLIVPATGSAFVVTLWNALDNPTQTNGTPLEIVTSSTTGTGDWFVSSVTQTTIDGFSAQTGSIGPGMFSRLETNVTGPASISFYQRISSEPTNDTLSFYDGTKLVSRISGSVNWVQKSYLLSQGTHTLAWEYKKNATVSKGTDAAWVNKLVVSPNLSLQVHPNNGGMYDAGAVEEIRWLAPAPAEKYKLYYSENNGTSWLAVPGADNLTGTTSSSNNVYSWTIPVPMGNKNTYKVKVVAYSQAGAVVGTDVSDLPFSVRVLGVTRPNVGDSLSANANDGPAPIQFSIFGQQNAASAALTYSTDGATWLPVATVMPVTGPFPAGEYNYSWNVPSIPALKTNCKVKVTIRNAANVVLGTVISNAFTIRPTFAISGVVTANGSPLAGVGMTLAGAEGATTTTDGAGKYSFTKLLAGSYTVTPAKTGYVFNPAVTAVAITTANNTATSFKATASAYPTYGISGAVSGDATSGVKITLAGPTGATVLTDNSGNYSFGNLPAGSYTLAPAMTGFTFDPVSSIAAVVNAPVTGKDFVSATSIGATYGISGKVTLGGIGKAGVTITLSDPNNGAIVYGAVITDAVGNYSIKGLKKGSYKVTPTAFGYVFTQASRTVLIGSSSLTGISFAATALPRIAAPNSVGAIPVTAGQILVQWSAVPGALGYNVYGAATAPVAIVPGNKLNNTTIDALEYGNKGLKPNTTRHYRVTAVDDFTESLGSADVSATTAATITAGTIQGMPLMLADPAVVTTFAGVSSGTTGTADGIGAAAGFNNPFGVTTDGENLYVTDGANNAVRKIVIATGEVTTFAGVASSATGTVDGIGAAARFNWPIGITTDGNDLYVVDNGNYTIRQIDIATGEVSTLAGTPGAIDSVNGTGAAASFYYPVDITIDGTTLYVTENLTDKLRKIDLVSKMVTSIDTTPAESRYFNGLTVAGAYLYSTCMKPGIPGATICRIDPATGAVSDIAGNPAVEGSADGTGTAATFTLPTGITTDGTNLYVTDISNGTVRKVVITTGEVTTLSSGWGIWNWPRGITTDGISLFVAVQSYNCVNRLE